MTCENQLCIYWEDGACILREVHLDTQGSCMECILVELTEEFLEEKRRELLDKICRQEAAWRESRVDGAGPSGL